MLVDEPYTRRREWLEELHLSDQHWQTPPYQVGQGQAMMQASLENGLEGVIAKRLDSVYEMGRRSGAWLKVKNAGRTPKGVHFVEPRLVGEFEFAE
jgi:bifunctional non-homologous end joining protein LigD